MCEAWFEPLEPRQLLSAVAIMRPDFLLHKPISVQHQASSAGVQGVTPDQLRRAYGIDQISFGGIIGDGTGQTIAIVDAYNAPTLAADMATFDSYFKLAAPASLKIIGETGTSSLPRTDPSGPGNSWAMETSLDVEWAHVVAPKASIIVVEANSASDTDLFKAVDTARRQSGVSVVSMNWGGSESSAQTKYDSYFTTPANHIGVTFVAASGDSGSYDYGSNSTGVNYPASSPNVVGVGGTTLSISSAGSYISETAWGNGRRSGSQGGTGGGLSRYVTQPAYQKGVVTQSSTYRAVPDVAMDADPSSGVAVVDSWDSTGNPWVQLGGTSLAVPLWAGVIALVDQGQTVAGKGTLDGASQTLPKLYALPATDFHDITSGNNGAYSAGTGYDLLTGRGTPIVNLLAPDMAGLPTPTPAPTPTPTATQPTIDSLHVNPGSVTAGASVTLTAVNVADTSGAITQVAFYREVMPSRGPQPIQDHLIGYGTQQGSDWSITASTTGMAAGTYTLYAIATNDSGQASTAATGSATVQAAPTPTPTPTPTAPVITSLQVNPTTVIAGKTIMLTATGVTMTMTRGSRVAFYTEADSTQGPQPGTDHLIGYGRRQGDTWAVSATTSHVAPGTYTVYAIATDGSGNSSAPVTATIMVQAAPAPVSPVVASLTANPSPVTVGARVTLSASVTATAGTYVNVAFYRVLDPTQGPQPVTDHLIGYGQRQGNTWTITADTSNVAPGTYSLYVIATDASGNSSVPVLVTVTVLAPDAGTTGSSSQPQSGWQAGRRGPRGRR